MFRLYMFMSKFYGDLAEKRNDSMMTIRKIERNQKSFGISSLYIFENFLLKTVNKVLTILSLVCMYQESGSKNNFH